MPSQSQTGEDRPGSARSVSVESITRLLSGIQLPITKTGLVRYAREHRDRVLPATDADANAVLHVLERLPSKAFQTMASIEREVRKILTPPGR